jgi:hypothetical protein
MSGALAVILYRLKFVLIRARKLCIKGKVIKRGQGEGILK